MRMSLEYYILGPLCNGVFHCNLLSRALTTSVSNGKPASVLRIPYMEDESKDRSCSFATRSASFRFFRAISATHRRVPASFAQLMPCPTSFNASVRSDQGRSSLAGMYAPVVNLFDMERANGPYCCSKSASMAWLPRPVFSAKTCASATISIMLAVMEFLSAVSLVSDQDNNTNFLTRLSSSTTIAEHLHQVQ